MGNKTPHRWAPLHPNMLMEIEIVQSEIKTTCISIPAVFFLHAQFEIHLYTLKDFIWCYLGLFGLSGTFL